MTSSFSYAIWDSLLRRIVSPSGKVDYPRLSEERTLLQSFIDELAARSPNSDPELFPADEDRLAYWINAYNAFTLHAIAQEYPIPSVWRTREGQFFQRRQHIAGGHALSLDEIEHEILRGDFAEPRIHFAINCGSGGCPPLRSEAYQAETLPATLEAATRTFLADRFNYRVDHESRRIFVSRLFKMYAEDFAGRGGTREDYRSGVLRFIAEHTDLAPETVADYEVVYNVYDWGLNDTAREPHIGPILFYEPAEHFSEGDRELRELYLYEGNFCNRSCSWCTVNGSSEGWYQPYSTAVLDQAVRTIALDGNLNFYGGEPTLHVDTVIEAMQYVRAQGFEGTLTIFSNGVRAKGLIQLLDSDPRSQAVLNYSIFHGRDAEPIPVASKRRLEQWAEQHPHRLFKGGKVLHHAGAGVDHDFDRDREGAYYGMGTGCLRCLPVLTSAGEFRACPYAVEIDTPHFDLGRVGKEPEAVFADYRRFLDWVDDVLDPAAAERGITSCEMCHRHVSELPPPAFGSQASAPAARPRSGVGLA